MAAGEKEEKPESESERLHIEEHYQRHGNECSSKQLISNVADISSAVWTKDQEQTHFITQRTFTFRLPWKHMT